MFSQEVGKLFHLSPLLFYISHCIRNINYITMKRENRRIENTVGKTKGGKEKRKRKRRRARFLQT